MFSGLGWGYRNFSWESEFSRYLNWCFSFWSVNVILQTFRIVDHVKRECSPTIDRSWPLLSFLWKYIKTVGNGHETIRNVQKISKGNENGWERWTVRKFDPQPSNASMYVTMNSQKRSRLRKSCVLKFETFFV
jgi:hypothetical protein